MKYLLQAAGRRGAIYSCDKLVLGFKALGRNAQHLLDWLGGPLAPEFSRWESRRLGTFRDQFSISVETHIAFFPATHIFYCRDTLILEHLHKIALHLFHGLSR